MASKSKKGRRSSRPVHHAAPSRPWVQRPLGLIAVGCATYVLALGVLAGARHLRAEAAPSPIVLTDFGMKDTTGSPANAKESFGLASNAGGIYQVDNPNRLGISYTDLGPSYGSGAVERIDTDDTSGDVIFGASNGDIVRADTTTGTVSTIQTVASADFRVAAADNNSASTDAWAIDANTNDLYKFTSSGSFLSGNPSFGNGPIGLGGPKPGNNNVIALGDGSAEIYRLDVTMLVDYDDTFTGANVEPTGLAVASADYCYVSINDGTTAKVLQVDTSASNFGFVSPVMATYPNLSAVDISVAGPWVTVLMSDSTNNETTARVFDVAVPSSPLYVGSVELLSGYLPYGGLSTWLDGGETYDDLQISWGMATQDMAVTSGRDIDEEWTPAAPGNVPPGGVFPTITAAASGAYSMEAINCTDCPPFDTEAQGALDGPSPQAQGGAPTGVVYSAGSVQYSTGEEVLSHKLVSIPGRGMDVTLSLTYRSRRDFDGRYGNSWFLNQDVRMKTETNGDMTYQSPYGRLDTYVKSGTNFISPIHYDTTLAPSGSNHTVTDRFGRVSTFNASGQRTSLADRYGNSHTYTYTGDKLTQITDSLGRNIALNYDGTGRLSSVVDFGGRTWSFSYDYMGNLRTITSPASTQFSSGRTTRFSYSPNHAEKRFQSNLIHVENAKHEVVQTLEYDGNDMVEKETLGPGLYTFSYDVANSRTTVVDRAENTTRWTFDANAVVTERRVYTKGLRTGEPTDFTTTYTVNSSTGMITAVVYPRGNRTDYTYDSSLNLTEVRHKTTNTSSNSGTDLVTSYQYTGLYNQLSQVTDPKGNVTTMTVDSSGNTTAVTRPTVTQPTSQSIAETFLYDSYGRITTATDAEGRATNFVYYTSGVKTDIYTK